MGPGQTGPHKGAPEGPEVPLRGGVLEVTDFLCKRCVFNALNTAQCM